MTIDRDKVTPSGKEEVNEITSMNVVGVEKDGKDKLVIAKTEKGEQFGEKDIKSDELNVGIEIPADNSINSYLREKSEKQEDNQK